MAPVSARGGCGKCLFLRGGGLARRLQCLRLVATHQPRKTWRNTMALSKVSGSSVSSYSTQGSAAQQMPSVETLKAAGLTEAQAKAVRTSLASATTGNPGERMEAAMKAAGVSESVEKSALSKLNGGKAKGAGNNESSSTDVSTLVAEMIKQLGLSSSNVVSAISSLSGANSGSNVSSVLSGAASNLSNILNTSSFQDA
jgi:hypothetical protein